MKKFGPEHIDVIMTYSTTNPKYTSSWLTLNMTTNIVLVRRKSLALSRLSQLHLVLWKVTWTMYALAWFTYSKPKNIVVVYWSIVSESSELNMSMVELATVTWVLYTTYWLPKIKPKGVMIVL